MTDEGKKDMAARLLHASAAGDGVSQLREYCDTHHAYEVLFEE